MFRDWNDFPVLLTMQHIAKLFDCSTKTIYRRLQGDEQEFPQPLNKKARRKLWSREAVRRWVENQQEDSEAVA